ncbi:hypothetical protein ABIE50_005630 [Chitinophaga sp. OAE865]
MTRLKAVERKYRADLSNETVAEVIAWLLQDTAFITAI